MSGPGASAEQAERACGLVGERAVRAGQRRPQVGRRARRCRGRRGGSGLVSQLAGQRRRSGSRVAGGPGGDDAERQRQPAAVLEYGGHRLRLGVDPRSAQVADQQAAGLARRRARRARSGGRRARSRGPASSCRLVTSTVHVGVPGSSELTWSVSRALSRTISMRRSGHEASIEPRLRVEVDWDRAGLDARACRGSREPPRLVRTGSLAGSKPRRFTYS